MTISITGTATPPETSTGSVYPGPPKEATPSSPAARTTLSAAAIGLGALGATLQTGQAAVAGMTAPQADATQLSAVNGVLQQIQELLREANDPTVQKASRRAIEVNISGLQGQLGQLTDQSQAAQNIPAVATAQAQIADLQLPAVANTPTGDQPAPPTTAAGVDVTAAATVSLPASTPAAASSSLKVIDQTMEQIHQKQLASEAALVHQYSQASNADAARASIFTAEPAPDTSAAAAAASAAAQQIWSLPAQALAAQGAIAPDTAHALTS